MESRRRQLTAFINILMLMIWFTVGRMIGENGITYVAVALVSGAVFDAFVNAGLTECLGRMLRSRINKGQYKNVLRLKRYALLFQITLGFVIGLLVFLLAAFIAEDVLQIKYAAIIIKMLAPYILLRTITEVLLGIFQGEGQELPLIGIGVARAFFVLIFIYLFMGKLGDYGEKVSTLLQQPDFAAMYEGLAVALAVCVGELLCAILLAIFYKLTRPGKQVKQEGMRTTDTWTDCAGYLCRSRAHTILAQLLSCVPVLVSVIYWNKNATEDIGMTSAFGIYIGRYLPVCGILVLGLYALALPVLNKTLACIKKEDKRYARMVFQSGVHACAVQGIFFSVYIAVMSEQLAAVLVKDETWMLSAIPRMSNVEWMAEMLRTGSAIICLGGVALYFCLFLQNTGRKYMVSGVAAIAVAIFSIFLFIMSKAGLGTNMSPVYGGIVCLVIVCLLLGIVSYGHFRSHMDWLKVLLVPLGMSFAVGLLSMLLAKVVTPHLGNGFTLLLTLLPAMFLYWVLLLLTRNFREQELDVIVGGRMIAALGQLLRIF